MRYDREVRFRLEGDLQRAKGYTAFARTLLGDLIRRDIDLGGLSTAVVQRRLQDGTEIRCIVLDPALIPIIEIYAPPLGPTITPSTPDTLILDFVSVPNPYVLSGQRQTSFLFESSLEDLAGEQEPPFGVPRPAVLQDVSQLSGNDTSYTLLYRYGDTLFQATRTINTLPPGGASDPYEQRIVTIPLPAGAVQYVSRAYGPGSNLVFSPAHLRGELPRRVTANTTHVFVMVENVELGAGQMDQRLLIDIYDLEGVREFRFQMTPTYDPVVGIQVHILRDDLVAHNNGFYALLKPLPSLPGYDILKWSFEEGFEWSAPALPPDVTTPERIYAGPLGPYIADRVDDNTIRLSLLNPTNGETIAQTQIELSPTPLAVGEVSEVDIGVSEEQIFISTGVLNSFLVPFGVTRHRIHIYDHDLTFVRTVDGADIIEAAGIEFTLGYIVPYEDSAIRDAV